MFYLKNRAPESPEKAIRGAAVFRVQGIRQTPEPSVRTCPNVTSVAVRMLRAGISTT